MYFVSNREMTYVAQYHISSKPLERRYDPSIATQVFTSHVFLVSITSMSSREPKTKFS